MASIREVAKLAGVSPSTVSRVINGTANVDAEKKDRVLKAIEESGFTPNEVARSLFKKSSKTIGVIVPSITNPFFAEMSSAIEHTANQHGYRRRCRKGEDSDLHAHLHECGRHRIDNQQQRTEEDHRKL